MRYILGVVIMLLVCSCKESPKRHYASLLKEWINREVVFPDNLVFTVQGRDTVPFPLDGHYKILTYIDSIGCTSCKLQLDDWKKFMSNKDVVDVRFLFVFSPAKRNDILKSLKEHTFIHPVCIDETNKLDGLNHFPTEFKGQTFLLDENNKVLAVGNPIHNLKVKELYLKIIRCETVKQEVEGSQTQTKICVARTEVNLRHFDWREKQTVKFVLRNIGKQPLAVFNAYTSCGCIQVEYDQQPVQSGGSLDIQVTYKAEHPEHFDKTVTVYCNAEDSPIVLKIQGNAE